MNAAVASAAALALVWALLFVTDCAAYVFDVDQLNSHTFENLSSRGCLPKDLSDSLTLSPAHPCSDLVGQPRSNLPDNCQEAPLLALLFNCIADSRGLIADVSAAWNDDKQEAISSMYSAIKTSDKLKTTSDGEWINRTFHILDDCEAHSAAGLTPRQAAVSAFLCLRWSLFSDCDIQKEVNGTLDAIGARRGVGFICGDCPLSPGRPEMLAAIELLGGITLAECSVGKYSGPDVLQLYQAKVDKMICLLDRFQTGNKLDYAQLKDDIAAKLTGAHSEAAELLRRVVDECEGSNMTEDFVKCWVEIGVFSCVYEQANQVAAAFPDNCELSP